MGRTARRRGRPLRRPCSRGTASTACKRQRKDALRFTCVKSSTYMEASRTVQTRSIRAFGVLGPAMKCASIPCSSDKRLRCLLPTAGHTTTCIRSSDGPRRCRRDPQKPCAIACWHHVLWLVTEILRRCLCLFQVFRPSSCQEYSARACVYFVVLDQ